MIIKVIEILCTYMVNLKRSFLLHVLCLFKRANSEFGIEILFSLYFLCLFILSFLSLQRVTLVSSTHSYDSKVRKIKRKEKLPAHCWK